MLHDGPPGTLIACPTTVALIDDDEVKKVRWIFSEVRRPIRATHERLEDGKEDAPVLLDLPPLFDF